MSAAELCVGRRQEESGPQKAQGLSGGMWAMGSLRKALPSGEKWKWRGRVDKHQSTFSKAHPGSSAENGGGRGGVRGKEQNWAQGDKLGNNRSNPEGDGHVKARTEVCDFHRHKGGRLDKQRHQLACGA